MFEVELNELRAGDMVMVRDTGKFARVRDPHWQGSSEIVEVALGDIVNREEIVKAVRQYKTGDWRSTDANR